MVSPTVWFLLPPRPSSHARRQGYCSPPRRSMLGVRQAGPAIHTEPSSTHRHRGDRVATDTPAKMQGADRRSHRALRTGCGGVPQSVRTGYNCTSHFVPVKGALVVGASPTVPLCVLPSKYLGPGLSPKQRNDTLFPGVRSAANTRAGSRVAMALAVSVLRTSRRCIVFLLIQRCVIYIPKAKVGAREQPITAQLAVFLQGYLDALPEGCPWLFPSVASHTGHMVDI